MTEDPLIAFLNARLDEDEALAKSVEDNSDPWLGQWEADGNLALRTYNGWVLAVAGSSVHEFRPGVLAHIALHDPARVLREVEAGRAILANHDDTHDCGDRRSWEFPYVGCRDVLALAAIYSDHPDYRPEWKP